MIEEHPLDFNVKLGRFMRLIRRQRGLSLAEAGKLVGVTYQQMQKYEKGTNRISAAMLHRYAAHVRYPLGAFFENAKEDNADMPNTLSTGRINLEDAQAITRIENEMVRVSLHALVDAIGDQDLGPSDDADDTTLSE